MRFYLTSFFIVFGFILSAQTYSKIISDSAIIEFINKDILRDSIKAVKAIQRSIYTLNRDDFYYKDSIDFRIKNNTNGHFIFKYYKIRFQNVITNNIDTFFSRDDIDFFNTQLKGFRKRFYWKKSFINSFFIDEPELNANNYAKQTMYSYSIPLFSLDKKRAIIIKSFFCGFLCGGGGYYIYEMREDSQWELIKIINRWGE